MILKRNFNPVRVWSYIKQPMQWIVLWVIAIWFLHNYVLNLAIHFTPIAVLGSALAIFIAFRNNSAYARWWEARQLWGNLAQYSRELSRMVINFVDVQIRAFPNRSPEMNAFKKQIIYRHIAFVHALRIHLRTQHDWKVIEPFLSKEEFEKVLASQNKPNIINMINGDHLRKGQDQKMLEWFHTFQIEGNLQQFAHILASCERIKLTPLPRQYDYFTRVFVMLFALTLPFGLLTWFTGKLSWLMILASLILSGVFVIMERTGNANEDPFENLPTDVPMSSICNSIERDLKEMLGESDLPPRESTHNGYLY